MKEAIHFVSHFPPHLAFALGFLLRIVLFRIAQHKPKLMQEPFTLRYPLNIFLIGAMHQLQRNIGFQIQFRRLG